MGCLCFSGAVHSVLVSLGPLSDFVTEASGNVQPDHFLLKLWLTGPSRLLSLITDTVNFWLYFCRIHLHAWSCQLAYYTRFKGETFILKHRFLKVGGFSIHNLSSCLSFTSTSGCLVSMRSLLSLLALAVDRAVGAQGHCGLSIAWLRLGCFLLMRPH